MFETALCKFLRGAQEILLSLAKDAPLPEDDSSTVAVLKWYREG